MNSTTSALSALSNDIASTVDAVAASVVAVEARHRVGASGFYLRPNLILTADHALESDEVEIVHAGGTTERATIVGRDGSTDLALLRTESAGTPLAFASDDALRTGAIALAVARDDDGDVAASMGVISAVGESWRTWQGGEIDRFVRPDLALYARFSGSPLVDATGRALGMNTEGLSRRQSLTVPQRTIERVVEALLTRGHVARGYLGVQLQQVQLAAAQGSGTAAVVIAVEPHSPADHAGLIVGDLIAGIAGSRVDVDDLHAKIAGTATGSPLTLDVLRGGTSHAIAVTIGERPEHDDE